MKPETRDNLIYLGVGLGIAALVAADFFYTDGHGQKMWWPSRLVFRAAYTTLLLAYFVVKEARKMKATLVQILGYVLFASLVHLAIVFTFRHAASELSGITFAAAAVFEMFFVFQVLMLVVRYLRSDDSNA
jgi:branched-subunit amino acid transport protein AzlD